MNRDTVNPVELVREESPGFAASHVRDGDHTHLLARDRRFMNRDGSFNTRRVGRMEGFSYLTLLNMSWKRFFVLATLLNLVSNVAFGLAYYLCGPQGLASNGMHPAMVGRLWSCFFFSIQTLSTIGYGGFVPVSLMANCVVAVESVYGVLAYAFITGLFFARISRTRARLRFSRAAVVYEAEGVPVVEVRISNRSRSEILDLSAKLIYSRLEGEGERAVRRFTPLPLERSTTAFLPLAWKVRHRIDAESPLAGMDRAALADRAAELLVLVIGMDESSGQTVSSRTSYNAAEIAFGKRHADAYVRDEAHHVVGIDFNRFDGLVDR